MWILQKRAPISRFVKLGERLNYDPSQFAERNFPLLINPDCHILISHVQHDRYRSGGRNFHFQGFCCDILQKFTVLLVDTLIQEIVLSAGGGRSTTGSDSGRSN
jgi:hypothetical protein